MSSLLIFNFASQLIVNNGILLLNWNKGIMISLCIYHKHAHSFIVCVCCVTSAAVSFYNCRGRRYRRAAKAQNNYGALPQWANIYEFDAGMKARNAHTTNNEHVNLIGATEFSDVWKMKMFQQEKKWASIFDANRKENAAITEHMATFSVATPSSLRQQQQQHRKMCKLNA